MISMVDAMTKARELLAETYDVPEERRDTVIYKELERVATAIYQGERIEALTAAIRAAYTPTYVYSVDEEVTPVYKRGRRRTEVSTYEDVICDYIMDSKPYSTLWAECPKCGCGFRVRPSGKCNVYVVEGSDE